MGRGRGRGRGRGSGQAILPAGLWESIRGDADDDNGGHHQQQHKQQPALPELPQQHYEPHNNDQFEDAADYGPVKGRGRHSRRDDDEIRGKPVFKKGDWECQSCMNMNWSWRTHCNMCNAPRLGVNDPVTFSPGLPLPASSHLHTRISCTHLRLQAGVRDGAGGGFNERQERYVRLVGDDAAFAPSCL